MNIFGTSFNYEARLGKVRRMMEERDIDCVLVRNSVNQYYLSGFYQHLPWYPVEHSTVSQAPLIIFKEGPPIFLCAILTVNAVKEGTWIKDVRAFDRESRLSVHEYLAEVLKERGLTAGNIGVEEDCCTISTFRKFQELLPKAQVKDAAEIFYLARMVKDPDEIQLIRESVAIGEAAMKVAIDVAKPGVSEMDVQRAVEIEMRRRGGIREVETMCQSGIRTANYRAFAAEWKKIEENELVAVDLGCVYKGYGCDITRTWSVGKPTAEQKKIAGDLYRTHEKVLDFIKPGLKYYEVHDFVHKEMSALGYRMSKLSFPFATFSLHGIGLGPMHDPPDRQYNEIGLEAGMTLSIQSCVRQEKFTIRFEDDALITPKGLEMLTTFPRELI